MHSLTTGQVHSSHVIFAVYLLHLIILIFRSHPTQHLYVQWISIIFYWFQSLNCNHSGTPPWSIFTQNNQYLVPIILNKNTHPTNLVFILLPSFSQLQSYRNINRITSVIRWWWWRDKHKDRHIWMKGFFSFHLQNSHLKLWLVRYDSWWHLYKMSHGTQPWILVEKQAPYHTIQHQVYIYIFTYQPHDTKILCSITNQIVLTALKYNNLLLGPYTPNIFC